MHDNGQIFIVEGAGVHHEAVTPDETYDWNFVGAQGSNKRIRGIRRCRHRDGIAFQILLGERPSADIGCALGNGHVFQT